METPFTWFVIRNEAPAGRSSVLLAGAVVTVLLAMSIVTALVRPTGPAADTVPTDRSHVLLESPTSVDSTLR